MTHRAFRTLVGLAVAAGLVAACTPGEGPGDGINPFDGDAILRDIKALSADDMEGRATGTPGKERAAAFIEQRYQEAGLEPVNGSYRQTVRLVGMRRNDADSLLRIAGPEGDLPLEDGVNVAYWSTAQDPLVEIDAAPLLFVGYGVTAPEYDWDDFKGTDVAGKVLLFLNNDPPVTEDGRELFGGEARTYYGRYTYKFEQAMGLGAAGAIMVHTTPSASYGFSVISGSGVREHFALDLPGSGFQVPLLAWLDENQSNTIAAAIGTDLEGLFEMARDRAFEPVDTGFRVSARIATDVRQMTTSNVIGMLPGSDPELTEQVIVFSAHYDHLGVNPNLEGDDKTFNGAWDNATGTAAIIALAGAFADGGAPRRSLLFLACAGEESGLLGSAWFVADPPFERSRLVADFNIDMPQIFGVTTDIAAIGIETNSLGAALVRHAAAMGVEVDGERRPINVTGDPNPSAGSFYRSDQVSFAKAGIPALFLNPGRDYVEPLGFDVAEYRSQHYHQPSDEVRPEWNMVGLERDLWLVMQVATNVADADTMPRWAPGNEFEEEWRQLHGMQ